MLASSPVRIVGCVVLASLTALAALTSLACNAARHSEDAPSTHGAFERLQELQPTDIAVAPVRDQTDAQKGPLDIFRTAFIETLIERRYSPLAPSYVDANWVEASFKGTPPPDALMVIALEAWDPTHLFSTGKVLAAANVVLFEGGDTTGKVLWQRNLKQEVDLGDGHGHPPAAGQDLIPKAVRKFAQKALEDLPMRDPVAAHATKEKAAVK